MRINPISMANIGVYGRHNLKLQKQNNQNGNQSQNISFGKFEDEKAKTETVRIMSEPDSYDGKRTDFDMSIKSKKAALEFLDTTPYVTVKHNYGLTYVVANRESYKNHEFKSDFDEMFDERIEWKKRMQDDFDNDKRYPAIKSEIPALRKRLPELEPDYLFTLYDNKTRKQLTEDENGEWKLGDYVCHSESDVSRLMQDIWQANRDLITRELDKCKRIYPDERNKFIRITECDNDKKTISFQIIQDPFGKNEKPAENLGRIRRFLFNRELNNRCRMDERYHIIVNVFKGQHGLKADWPANIDCNTEEGVEQLRLAVELSDLLQDTFFPLQAESAEDRFEWQRDQIMRMNW